MHLFKRSVLSIRRSKGGETLVLRRGDSNALDYILNTLQLALKKGLVSHVGNRFRVERPRLVCDAMPSAPSTTPNWTIVWPKLHISSYMSSIINCLYNFYCCVSCVWINCCIRCGRWESEREQNMYDSGWISGDSGQTERGAYFRYELDGLKKHFLHFLMLLL